MEFRPTPYPIENLRFCVVIVGKNNGASLEKTLQSVFSQNYGSFRVVYVDDASDDGSYDLAKDLIEGSPSVSIQLLRNEQPLGTLASLSKAIRECPDEEIIVVLNGKDWLAHEWVLMRLNQYYADPDLWLFYGPSRSYPSYQLDSQNPLQREKPIRSQSLAALHLKTFYASLFKRIEEDHFLYQGEYFPGAADFAYMCPLLEMAEGHCHYSSETLYICNREVAFAEDRELEAFFENYIRSLPPYLQIKS